VSTSVTPRHLSPKLRRASASTTQCSTLTLTSPVLVFTTSPVAPSHVPRGSLAKSSKASVHAAPQKSWIEPVESVSVPKVSFPISRRRTSRPATDTDLPVEPPGSRPACAAWRAAAPAVRSNRYGISGMECSAVLVGPPLRHYVMLRS